MLSGTHRFPKQDQITYGRPAAEVVAELAKAWGCSRLLVTSTRSLADGLANDFAAALGELCVGVFCEIGAHSPRAGVIGGAQAAREAGADLLVALGGGSVIDATKVMQLCLWADLTGVDQLDAYRAGRGPDRINVTTVPAGVRMIAVPTTLSAAEFTPFAGVSDAARNVKEGYTHPLLAPRAVVLDPAMTLSTP
ncbi:iron-containing alcohol dehydrogenase, partial [Phenylobacterium sp.]|uniref:iron-containing alcohol dehydrogenase n=1 Tax=Phenylobacterium sp. TaxID=1871053 RepID=UPI002EDB2D70